ncbi:Hypothetical protein PHPALM_1230, partial [Phytophthora palmivora]
MADFSDDAASSDENDQQHLDDECSPAWETAPDNDDEENEAGNEEDDAFSDRSKDYGEGEASDGDFEDAWLDDYLPESSNTSGVYTSQPPAVEYARDSPCYADDIDSQDENDRGASRTSSFTEMDTNASLMVVDAAGEEVSSVSSLRLAGLAALKGSNSF